MKQRSPIKPKSKSTMALWPRERREPMSLTAQWLLIDPHYIYQRENDWSADESYHMSKAALERATLSNDPDFGLFITRGIGRRPRAARRLIARLGLPPGTPWLEIPR